MNDFYSIDKSEVLKYLHCKKADDATISLIDSAYKLVCENITPRFIYRVLNIESVENDTVFLENSKLKLSGSDIIKHLEGCKKVILVAATLGESADKLLRIEQIRDMAQAVVLDCTLSSYIESFCSAKDAELRKIAADSNEYITSRFSPGYGNLPITLQRDILSSLDAQRKIGLNLTPENLLVPTKSITAVIGVSDRPVSGTLATCKNCVLKGKCEFIKNGTTCYKREME